MVQQVAACRPDWQPERKTMKNIIGFIGKREWLALGILTAAFATCMGFDLNVWIYVAVSVLFIGYSLNDINIRYLFYRFANLWKKSSRGMPQPMSFIFSTKPNPIQEAALAQWNIQMLSPNGDDPGQALIELLEQLQ